MSSTDASSTPFALQWPLTVWRSTLNSTREALHKATVANERLTEMELATVGQTAKEVVYRENKLRLLHYESMTDEQSAVPLLVVYALINRPSVLDLQPNRSVVRRMLEAGHDVYLIDWGEPSALDTTLTLDDYVTRYLDNCVDVVRERAGCDAVNLLGYCMGGTMATMYAALFPEKVNALGLLATGLYFEETGGVLEQWGDADTFDPHVVTETYGNVPAEFLATGFALMDPISNVVSKYISLYDNFENEDFVRNFARMEQWLGDGIDLAGEAYAQFIEDIYQQNLLATNRLELDGRHVDVSRIEMPVLQIVGTYDHLVPPAASTPFNDVVGSSDVATIEYPTGHIGLSVSLSAHRDLWPEVAEWFHEQSSAPTFADVIAEGVEAVLDVDVETDVTVGNVDEVEVSIAESDGAITRRVVSRDTEAIERFVEETLGVDIELAVAPTGIQVIVARGDTTESILVPGVSDAIRREVEEGVRKADRAARLTLQDVKGVGPTYEERLQKAGIESVTDLASADVRRISKAADVTHAQAQSWVDHASRLVA